MLGPGEAAEKAAERYRALVRIVDEATLSGSVPDRDIDTLLNYATWVRVTLRVLADHETIPRIHEGSPEYPILGLADHMPAWTPHPPPPGWDDETAVNAPLRRSTRGRVGSTTGAQQDLADPQPFAPDDGTSSAP